MKVFATQFLVPMKNEVPQDEKWSWQPANDSIKDIYASGANTSSRQSTYAAETDDRSDMDKPNEGMLLAA